MRASSEDSSRRQAHGGAKGDSESPEVGWGVNAEDGGDEIILRKIIYGILVTVVAILGVWILATRDSGGSQTPVLSARSGTGADMTYTVVLLPSVEPAQREIVDRMVATPKMQELSGPNEFRFVELVDGQLALCVGRAGREDAPELRQLLRRFRDFEAPPGEKPFAGASIQGCPE